MLIIIFRRLSKSLPSLSCSMQLRASEENSAGFLETKSKSSCLVMAQKPTPWAGSSCQDTGDSARRRRYAARGMPPR